MRQTDGRTDRQIERPLAIAWSNVVSALKRNGHYRDAPVVAAVFEEADDSFELIFVDIYHHFIIKKNSLTQ